MADIVRTLKRRHIATMLSMLSLTKLIKTVLQFVKFHFDILKSVTCILHTRFAPKKSQKY